jgi:hypothetical protein
MAESEAWYVVKQPGGSCEILPSHELTNLEQTHKGSDASSIESWGPFTSEAEATARRIGLIRAGKCQPI